jgi:regulator of RNase E activity RraB
MNDDAQVVREIAAVSEGDAPHTILHYLYVPTSEAASKIAEELKQRGFRTEERLGADGVNWLVLARHQAVPTEELMASMRRSMETLIAKIGGEYDGWEADVQHHCRHAH